MFVHTCFELPSFDASPMFDYSNEHKMQIVSVWIPKDYQLFQTNDLAVYLMGRFVTVSNPSGNACLVMLIILATLQGLLQQENSRSGQLGALLLSQLAFPRNIMLKSSSWLDIWPASVEALHWTSRINLPMNLCFLFLENKTGFKLWWLWREAWTCGSGQCLKNY